MTVYIALLRAVNVGGRVLRMDDLRRIAAEIGLNNARTFIASGNLLFDSDDEESTVKRLLEEALTKQMGGGADVMIRSAREMAGVVAANPFANEPANRVVAIFYDEPAAADAIENARNIADERLALGRREIYVHYPSGQGRSKLRLAGKSPGTARNMNTVAKLAELAREFQ